MAKAKCIICKAHNARNEAKRHPSLAAFQVYRLMLRRIHERDPDAIASICDDHRIPLVFNSVIIDLFKDQEYIKRLCMRAAFR